MEYYMETLYYYEYQTVIGMMTIASIDHDIVLCQFGTYDGVGIHQKTETIEKAYQQLCEYFQGTRHKFELNYRFIKGTDFQKKVWNALLTIPYGQCMSYQDIAQRVGSPKAYRAVGNANHHNPIVIFVPCHRVITASHQLGGYGGGIQIKKFLLSLEKNHV